MFSINVCNYLRNYTSELASASWIGDQDQGKHFVRPSAVGRRVLLRRFEDRIIPESNEMFRDNIIPESSEMFRGQDYPREY